MNHRLLDALDLLKMLEVVFEQRQALELNGENHSRSASNSFPWSGVRLTLRQSRELLQDLTGPKNAPKAPTNGPILPIEPATSEKMSFEQAVTHQQTQRSRASKEQPNGETGDKSYRGTFNRIQLTQEPQTGSSEDQSAPVEAR